MHVGEGAGQHTRVNSIHLPRVVTCGALKTCFSLLPICLGIMLGEMRMRRMMAGLISHVTRRSFFQI